MASGKTKPKLWRRMSKKYYDEKTGTIVRPGRQLKMFTVGYDMKSGATGLLSSLIKRIDVDTQAIFDKWNPKKEVKNETK
jgi:hypothetical protein